MKKKKKKKVPTWFKYWLAGFKEGRKLGALYD